jgi:AraC-like DNA-binding protein
MERELLAAVATGLGLADSAGRPSGPKAGGLAAWQEKRVTRYIVEHATAGIQVADLAAIARLSPGHFSRAFRASFGTSPYAMISRYRVSEAIRLMLGTDWPLVDIAEACGFADQSHFTRTFYRHTDTSPGRWRRSHAREGPSSWHRPQPEEN